MKQDCNTSRFGGSKFLLLCLFTLSTATLGAKSGPPVSVLNLQDSKGKTFASTSLFEVDYSPRDMDPGLVANYLATLSEQILKKCGAHSPTGSIGMNLSFQTRKLEDSTIPAESRKCALDVIASTSLPEELESLYLDFQISKSSS